jgi:hypothetical protein
MPSTRSLLCHPLKITTVLLISTMAGTSAHAQSNRAVTRPVGPDAGKIEQQQQPDGIVPSGGVELYQRMGATLPPLPPEKAYGGPVDEAYGAYQRGLYVTALNMALERAQKGDAAAQTLVAEMMTKGRAR